MSAFIYPYKQGSQSARALADAIGARMIRLENSRFTGSSKKLVINWGSTSMDNEEIEKCEVINKPEAVKLATNKLTFFERAKELELNIPEFTTDKDEARTWLANGDMVLGRTTLTGHSGRGIVVIETLEQFDNLAHRTIKLYVKYIKKKDEYRVHVINGEAKDIQRKALQRGVDRERVDFRVRNHGNGFIFIREGVKENCPEQVVDQAIKAVAGCGLDFGAADVIWNEYRKTAYVLEINTAPGLEGQTTINYAEGILDMDLEQLNDSRDRLREQLRAERTRMMNEIVQHQEAVARQSLNEQSRRYNSTDVFFTRNGPEPAPSPEEAPTERPTARWSGLYSGPAQRRTRSENVIIDDAPEMRGEEEDLFSENDSF